jgi:hypothetical protein
MLFPDAHYGHQVFAAVFTQALVAFGFPSRKGFYSIAFKIAGLAFQKSD